MFAYLFHALGIGRASKPVHPRSPHWPALRDAWLKLHPTCSACGTRTHVEVHHKIPVNWDPSLELDEGNLQSLCRSPGRECHLWDGHLGNYHSFNENSEEDAARRLQAIWDRPEPNGTTPAALDRLREKLRTGEMKEVTNKAFNSGCNARLAGQPIENCPLVDERLREYWRLGWTHVEENWGVDAKSPFPRLCEVTK